MDAIPEMTGARGSRRRRIDERELRVHAALVACVLFMMAALSLVGAGSPAHFRKPTFPDFAQFYAGARMLAAGDVGLLYVPREFLRALAASVPWTHETLFPPVYPAHVYAAFAPLARLPYGIAALLFTASSLALYVVAVRVFTASVPGRTTLRWFAIANPALLHAVMSGQLSTFGLLTLACAWKGWRDGRMFNAGLCLGSLAWKPQLLLFGIIAFAIRPGLPFAAGWAIALAIHAALFTLAGGSNAWSAYATVLARVSSSPEMQFGKTYQLQSLKGALDLMLPRGPAMFLLLGVLIAATLAVTIFIGRRSRDQRNVFAAVVVCGLLVSPHVYVYDMLLGSAALFLIGQAALDRGVHTRSDVAAYFLHWSPLLLPFVEVTRIQVGVVCALAWLAWKARETAATPSGSGDLPGSRDVGVVALLPHAIEQPGQGRRCE